MAARINKAVIKMLARAAGPLTMDPELVASVLQGAMAGVSRRLLESTDPGKAIRRTGSRTHLHGLRLFGRFFYTRFAPHGKRCCLCQL